MTEAMLRELDEVSAQNAREDEEWERRQQARRFHAWKPGDVAPTRTTDRLVRLQRMAEFLVSPTGLLLDAKLYRRAWGAFALLAGELHREAGEERPAAVWSARPGGPLSEELTTTFGEIL